MRYNEAFEHFEDEEFDRGGERDPKVAAAASAAADKEAALAAAQKKADEGDADELNNLQQARAERENAHTRA